MRHLVQSLRNFVMKQMLKRGALPVLVVALSNCSNKDDSPAVPQQTIGEFLYDLGGANIKDPNKRELWQQEREGFVGAVDVVVSSDPVPNHPFSTNQLAMPPPFPQVQVSTNSVGHSAPKGQEAWINPLTLEVDWTSNDTLLQSGQETQDLNDTYEQFGKLSEGFVRFFSDKDQIQDSGQLAGDFLRHCKQFLQQVQGRVDPILQELTPKQQEWAIGAVLWLMRSMPNTKTADEKLVVMQKLLKTADVSNSHVQQTQRVLELWRELRRSQLIQSGISQAEEESATLSTQQLDQLRDLTPFITALQTFIDSLSPNQLKNLVAFVAHMAQSSAQTSAAQDPLEVMVQIGQLDSFADLSRKISTAATQLSDSDFELLLRLSMAFLGSSSKTRASSEIAANVVDDWLQVTLSMLDVLSPAVIKQLSESKLESLVAFVKHLQQDNAQSTSNGVAPGVVLQIVQLPEFHPVVQRILYVLSDLDNQTFARCLRFIIAATPQNRSNRSSHQQHSTQDVVHTVQSMLQLASATPHNTLATLTKSLSQLPDAQFETLLSMVMWAVQQSTHSPSVNFTQLPALIAHATGVITSSNLPGNVVQLLEVISRTTNQPLLDQPNALLPQNAKFIEELLGEQLNNQKLRDHIKGLLSVLGNQQATKVFQAAFGSASSRQRLRSLLESGIQLAQQPGVGLSEGQINQGMRLAQILLEDQCRKPAVALLRPLRQWLPANKATRDRVLQRLLQFAWVFKNDVHVAQDLAHISPQQMAQQACSRIADLQQFSSQVNFQQLITLLDRFGSERNNEFEALLNLILRAKARSQAANSVSANAERLRALTSVDIARLLNHVVGLINAVERAPLSEQRNVARNSNVLQQLIAVLPRLQALGTENWVGVWKLVKEYRWLTNVLLSEEHQENQNIRNSIQGILQLTASEKVKDLFGEFIQKEDNRSILRDLFGSADALFSHPDDPNNQDNNSRPRLNETHQEKVLNAIKEIYKSDESNESNNSNNRARVLCRKDMQNLASALDGPGQVDAAAGANAHVKLAKRVAQLMPILAPIEELRTFLGDDDTDATRIADNICNVTRLTRALHEDFQRARSALPNDPSQAQNIEGEQQQSARTGQDGFEKMLRLLVLAKQNRQDSDGPSALAKGFELVKQIYTLRNQFHEDPNSSDQADPFTNLLIAHLKWKSSKDWNMVKEHLAPMWSAFLDNRDVRTCFYIIISILFPDGFDEFNSKFSTDEKKSEFIAKLNQIIGPLLEQTDNEQSGDNHENPPSHVAAVDSSSVGGLWSGVVNSVFQWGRRVAENNPLATQRFVGSVVAPICQHSERVRNALANRVAHSDMNPALKPLAENLLRNRAIYEAIPTLLDNEYVRKLLLHMMEIGNQLSSDDSQLETDANWGNLLKNSMQAMDIYQHMLQDNNSAEANQPAAQQPQVVAASASVAFDSISLATITAQSQPWYAFMKNLVNLVIQNPNFYNLSLDKIAAGLPPVAMTRAPGLSATLPKLPKVPNDALWRAMATHSTWKVVFELHGLLQDDLNQGSGSIVYAGVQFYEAISALNWGSLEFQDDDESWQSMKALGRKFVTPNPQLGWKSPLQVLATIGMGLMINSFEQQCHEQQPKVCSYHSTWRLGDVIKVLGKVAEFVNPPGANISVCDFSADQFKINFVSMSCLMRENFIRPEQQAVLVR